MTRNLTSNRWAIAAACLVVVSLVAAVGLGSVTAQSSETYGLNATDGAGGNASTLLADFDRQLPEGEASGNDTLEVVAEDDSLPNVSTVTLSLPEDSDVTFDTSQPADQVHVEAFGDNVTDTEGATVSSVDPDAVEIALDYNGSADEDVLLLPMDDGSYDHARGVRAQNLTFNTSSPETTTVTWAVRNDQTAYTLRVEPFDAAMAGTDENGGQGALVTAGANNQSLVGVDGADTLILEGDVEEFPERFSLQVSAAEITPAFADALTADDLAASSPHGTTEVTNVNDSAIVVRVTEFSVDDEDDALVSVLGNDSETSVVVELAGVTFDVPPDADAGDIVWQIRGEQTAYSVTPERLDVAIEDSASFPRGLDSQPPDGVTATIDAAQKDTAGFHPAGENMTLTIPQEELQFDTSSELSGTVSTGGFLGVSDDDITEFWIEEDTVTFQVPSDIHNESTITIDGIRFNTTAYNATMGDETAAFDSGLSATYRPIDPHAPVSITTSDRPVSVTVPAVSVGDGSPAQLFAGMDGQDGAGAVTVNVTDTAGGQMAPGSQIRIRLTGDDTITFDDRQSDRLVVEDTGADFWADIHSVTPREIVLEATEARSTEGDVIHLVHKDGAGIRFNASAADGGDTARLVTETTAGDAPVVQDAGVAASVFEGNVSLSSDDGPVTVHRNETVVVTATDTDDDPVAGYTVTATGPPLDSTVTRTTNTSGMAALPLTAATAGAIEIAGATSNILTLSAEPAALSATPDTIVANETTPVTVTVASAANEPLDDVNVEATGAGITDTANQTRDGEAEFEFTPQTDDPITITAPDLSVNTTVVVESAEMAVSHDEITVGEETNITVTLTRDGDPVENATVTASNETDALETPVSGSTDHTGTTTLPLEPVAPGSIPLDATAPDASYTVTDTVAAVANITVIETQNLTAGENATVHLQVTGANDDPLDNVAVTATGTPITETTNDTHDGETVFRFAPQEGGDITFHARGTTATVTVDGAHLTVSETEVTPGENTSVTVTLTNASTTEGVPVSARGPLTAEPTTETDSDGTATLPLNATQPGAITITANASNYTASDTIAAVAAITIEAPDDATMTAGSDASVTVNVTGAYNQPLNDVPVRASGDPLAPTSTPENETTDGLATLSLNTTEAGTVTLAAPEQGIATPLAVDADIAVAPSEISEGEETDVTITVTGVDNEPLSDVDVTADGTFDGDNHGVTDENGTTILTIEPTDDDTITITALGVSEPLAVAAEDDSSGNNGNSGNGGNGGSGGAGGGGGAGGAASSGGPSANITVANATLSTTEAIVGESINVTIVLENTGDADGSHEVRVGTNTISLANQTVNVPEDETRTVTQSVFFESIGERTIVADDTEVGIVTVAAPPAGLIAFDASPITDTAPNESGTRVPFDDIIVDAITFDNASTGNGTATIAVLETRPTDLEPAPGERLAILDITVPDALTDETATITFTVDSDAIEDPAAVHLARYTDEWTSIQPDLRETTDGEHIYVAETPGFSYFAITDQSPAEETTPTTTPGDDDTDGDNEPTEEAGFLESFWLLFVGIITLAVSLVLGFVGFRMYRDQTL